MPKPDTLDLDALEKIAKAATPGKWELYHDNFEIWVSFDPIMKFDEAGYYDAAHIAAFDPPTVLTLIEAARERDHLRQFCNQAAVATGEHGFVCSDAVSLRAELATARTRMRQAVEALEAAAMYIERARLNLSFAKQDAVKTAAEAESNRNSAYHDCVAAGSILATLTAALGDQPPAPASKEPHP